jgi:Nitrogenase component 1 type Oxidoreductase
MEARQQTRREAKLNQVVCTLEGMATLLQRTPGDFAVVIHGDGDCANVLTYGMDHPGAQRFFCTQISPDEAVAGRSLPVLRECLEALCEELSPEVIFVLGTCLSALVGDDVESVTRAVAAHHGVRVVDLAGAGMRFVPQGVVVDRFARLMAGTAPAPAARPDPRAVNLVGFDPGPEVRRQLAQLGVTVNAVLDLDAAVDQWQRLASAQWNLVLDEALFEGFLSDCADRGMDSIEVAYPVGAASTDAFFARVLSAVCPGVQDGPVLAGPREAAHQAVARGREIVRGLRLGYNLGSKKDLNPRTLAREGLAEFSLFEELGFDLVLLVQGDDRPARVAAVRQTLAELGCETPLAVFSDTVFYAGLCRDEGVRLTYASDHLRDLVVPTGVGFLENGVLRAGYTGVVENVRRIIAALDSSGGGS